MSTIKRFEDLNIWKDARELCRFIFQITSRDPFQKDYRFGSAELHFVPVRDQIRASCGSIMDNIAAETKSQVYRAYDMKYLSEEEQNDLLDKTERISKRIGSLIQHLKTSNFKGHKFQ